MSEKNSIEPVDRRGFIQQASLGVVAAGLLSAAPVMAQPSMAQEPLQDPTAKYPKPPFPEQKQPWPGLASKMTPRPDHGERRIADRGGCEDGRR